MCIRDRLDLLPSPIIGADALVVDDDLCVVVVQGKVLDDSSDVRLVSPEGVARTVGADHDVAGHRTTSGFERVPALACLLHELTKSWLGTEPREERLVLGVKRVVDYPQLDHALPRIESGLRLAKQR